MDAAGVTRVLLIILLASLTSALPVQAAEKADPEPVVTSGNQDEPDEDQADGDDKKPEAERFRLLPIPIFITEPAIGEGLGVALTLFHPVKEGKGDSPRLATLDSIGDMPESREAPPVITAVAGAYTNSESWMAGIGHFNNWRNDSIRYAGALATAKINSQIYIQNIPLSFSMKAGFLYQDLKFRVKESNFMLGAGFSYLDADNKFGIGVPDRLDDDRFATDFRNIGLAAKASFETRDNMMNPRSGQIVELSLWRYDEVIGGDYDYWSAKLKALSFHSLTEKATLGLRLDFSGVDGRAPFFAIPFVKLRGVPALRYQNKIAGAVEVEGRYLIRPRWEVSLFGGLGYTSDDYPIFDNTDSIYNFGVGGRYNIFQAHNVWVGIDIARGPEDWNWYIQVGHPW
jgi:hypothetical protein